MRAVAVGLLLLRHVHLVHLVHQVHPAKCFVTKTCASAFDRAPGIRLGLFAGAYRQPLLRRLPKGQDGVIPVPTFGPGGTGRRRWSRGSQVGVAPKFVAKCFENLPAFLRKDFQNLLPRFARGGMTIVSYLNNFPPPLDPHLSADSG